jgi:hypothetical protein
MKTLCGLEGYLVFQDLCRPGFTGYRLNVGDITPLIGNKI